MIEPGIGGKCNGFVLYGSVYIHHRQRGSAHCSGFKSSPYRQAQHEFAAILTDPIPKPGHLARVNGHFMPKVFFTTEVLPVGILYPAFHHRLIRFVKGVLEIVQPNHETDRDARAASLCVESAKALFYRIPVNLARQPVQNMTLIQYLFQAHAE